MLNKNKYSGYRMIKIGKCPRGVFFFLRRKILLPESLHLHECLRNIVFIRMMLINVFMIERCEKHMEKRNWTPHCCINSLLQWFIYSATPRTIKTASSTRFCQMLFEQNCSQLLCNYWMCFLSIQVKFISQTDWWARGLLSSFASLDLKLPVPRGWVLWKCKIGEEGWDSGSGFRKC